MEFIKEWEKKYPKSFEELCKWINHCFDFSFFDYGLIAKCPHCKKKIGIDFFIIESVIEKFFSFRRIFFNRKTIYCGNNSWNIFYKIKLIRDNRSYKAGSFDNIQKAFLQAAGILEIISKNDLAEAK